MLRIAVPNKGSLSEAASAMLHEAGYRQRKDRRELVLVDPDNDVEFFFLRPRDIAVYVGSGRSTSASPAATCCWTPAPTPRRSCRSASPRSTFRFAGPPGDRHRRRGARRA